MNPPGLITVIIGLLIAAGALLGWLYQQMRRKNAQAVQMANRLAEERTNELRILKELAEALNQTLPPDKALEVGLAQVAQRVGASSGWFLTLTPDQKADLSAGYNLPHNLDLASNTNRPWALCACLKEMLEGQLQTPQLFNCERLAHIPGIAADEKQHLSIPIRASSVPVGILNLVFPTERTFDENELRLLAVLGDQFGGAIERARLFKEIHRLAITDPLTGLYNRRHLLAMTVKEMERARRYHHALSLAMIDIDHFKNINDTFGHLAGDLVLRSVADLCQKAIRRIDLAGRFGGEELIIIMPETAQKRAQQAMERLRQQVEQLEIATPRGIIQVTISVGVTSLAENETIEFETFLDRTDQALYLAKNNGRNQVCML